MRFFIFLVCLLLPLQTAFAAVEIALRGKEPVYLEDVFRQQGVPYIAIEDALAAVGLSGNWNSITHTFRIKTKYGWAEISPASEFLKIAGEHYPLKEKPRFIDGRLRVTDGFVLNQLAQLTGRPVFFRNLNPDGNDIPEKKANNLEKLFSFLLNKKASRDGPLIRAVAIDPGHGGLDTGVIAPSGLNEKDLNLEIAEKLARQLKMRLGIPVYLSRVGDYELTLEQRLQVAAQEDVDIWLLLHAQASFSPATQGVSLFIRAEDVSPNLAVEIGTEKHLSDSMRLAKELALALRESSIDVVGIFPTSRLSLGRGSLPTVQIELGFLSNPEELELLQDSKYQDQLVQAIFAGINHYATKSRELKDGNN